MLLLALIGLLLVAASVVLVVRAITLPQTRAADRVREIEAYGFSGSATAVPDGAPAPTFGELAGRIGVALGKRLGGFSPEALQREIMAAGLYRLSATTLLGYRVLAAVAFGVFALLLSVSGNPITSVLLVACAAVCGWFAPLVLVRRRARLRMEEIDRELPDVIDLVVVTVQAGLGLAASLRVASTKVRGPLGDELRLLMQEQKMGRSLSEAMNEMLARADTPSMRSFVRSVTQGEALGVSIGTIMRNLADEMRKRRRAAVEERAQKTPVKLLLPLVFLIFPSMLILLMAPSIFDMIDALSNGF